MCFSLIGCRCENTFAVCIEKFASRETKRVNKNFHDGTGMEQKSKEVGVLVEQTLC